ncbi:copper ion binding protein [Pontibacillus halophilus JSM 076056 = DSM 19796]|uniref:Copper chaperone CopZ n=1 Tax=Pontibacillus halophilus JSM 076056 = DSM 19796 TaxID=1385510 RepID=A0A0A5IAH4_9BACI|nr:copper chaperone CopZ [Pontibacillus halophilus]KGX92837.1 copper ion binding protein [Pontibacillus halophilus JSM 076056 = DSM 19796]
MQITLSVEGMTCNHCEKAVKGALKEFEGVQGVEVHLESGNVDVMYDDVNVTKEQLKEAIEEQGYDVVS